VSTKHSDPEYVSNARIIRKQVALARRLGEDVLCWRCRRPLRDDEPFDVGHVHPAGGHGFDNLAPEHRHKTATCRGNRSAGGALGAQLTNARRTARTAPRVTNGLPNWR
jgi:hypothetical protein